MSLIPEVKINNLYKACMELLFPITELTCIDRELDMQSVLALTQDVRQVVLMTSSTRHVLF